MKKKEQNKGSRLKVIPLGGLEQIGMNITAFEYEDSIVVVDCGLSFPEDDMLGIDLVIPDITYLKNNIEKVKGFVITHGHEDHIGALPYVLKEINVPVYATRLTMGLIENKLKEHNLTGQVKRKVVKFGQSINLGQFRIEFIKTNHSIVDAAALAIYSPAGIVVHTGDFKVDYTPVFGDAIDLGRFAELGKMLGMSKAGIFKYYKNKQELFIAVVDKFCFSAQNPRNKFTETNGTFAEFIDEYVKGVQRTMDMLSNLIGPGSDKVVQGKFSYHAQYFHFLFQLLQYDPNAKEKLHNLIVGDYAYWRTAIQRAINTGELRKDVDVEDAVVMFRQVYMGLSFEMSFLGGLDTERLAKHLRAVYSLLKC